MKVSCNQGLLITLNIFFLASTPERSTDDLSFDLEADLNGTLCVETVSKEEQGLSNSEALKNSCCSEFMIPKSLRISEDNNSHDVLDFRSLTDSPTFDEDLGSDNAQPLMLNGNDTLNFPLEQGILDLNNSDEVSINRA